jgi:polyhydroxyalkanoate synthesis regulator phasin
MAELPDKSETAVVVPRYPTFQTGLGIMTASAAALAKYFEVNFPLWALLLALAFRFIVSLHGLLQYEWARRFTKIFLPTTTFIVGVLATYLVLTLLHLPQGQVPVSSPMTVDGLDSLGGPPIPAQVEQLKAVEDYTAAERAKVREMLADIDAINSGELRNLTNEVREIYKPWVDRQGKLDNQQANDTMQRINDMDRRLKITLDKMYNDMGKKYSLHWDIVQPLFDKDIKGQIHPIDGVRQSLGRMSNTLSVYREVENNLIQKPDPRLVYLLFPVFLDVEANVNTLDTWISENAAWLKSESNRFRAQ